jgi:hypothetical protein
MGPVPPLGGVPTAGGPGDGSSDVRNRKIRRPIGTAIVQDDGRRALLDQHLSRFVTTVTAGPRRINIDGQLRPGETNHSRQTMVEVRAQ